MLFDSCGRRVDYLRLSVTARCNLRCEYCLPEEGYRPPPDQLDDAQVEAMVRAFVRAGVRRVRVTGGEPLARPGVTGLIARLSRVPGVEDLSMSTNGVLLAPLARALKDAGLARVNISLDTLDPARFAAVTRRAEHARVLEGVEAALAAGLSPVKLNAVVVRGVNDDELARFVDLTRERPLHVRFIELMPIGETGYFSRARWVSLAEMRQRCGRLEPVPAGEAPEGGGPARIWRAPGALGTVGFISALSDCFCASCNRARLSAEGKLYPCLTSVDCADLRPALREGEGALISAIRAALKAKPEGHAMARAEDRVKDSFMCALGG